MGLTVDESRTLCSMLAGGNQRSFLDIIADFAANFPRNRQFIACYSLASVLEPKNSLHATERLVAFSIIHQAYSSQKSSSNPFISFIVHAASDEGAEKYERAFILQLLTTDSSSGDKEFLKQSASDYIAQFNPSVLAFPKREELLKQFCEEVQCQSLDSFSKDGFVRNVVPDPDVPPGRDANFVEFDQQPEGVPKVESGVRDVVWLLSNVSVQGSSPEWIRPPPPRLSKNGELLWLKVGDHHELLWDDGMCADTSRGAGVRNLIAKALKGPLVPAQEEEMVEELTNDPKLVCDCGLTPKKLPELVEKNPHIAVEVIKTLQLIDSPEIVEYFHVFVNMDLSVHSIEVFDRLTTDVELPSEFIQMYINNCMSSCEGIKDKYAQSRLVRLLCVFLGSLIQNEIINVGDLFNQIQTFCIKFGRIREATALYRLLTCNEWDVNVAASQSSIAVHPL